MLGALAIVLVLVILLPVATWAVAAGAIVLLGRSLVRRAEATHQGSELLDVNR